jgi:hypothetical protein
MSALIVTLLVVAAEPSLESALRSAVSRPGARVELTSWSAPSGCRGEFLPASFDSSGRVPVRVRGRACQAWGWANVRVYVPTAVLTRDVKANEAVDGAWVVHENEPKGEALAHVPAGATATRWLRKGQQVGPADVRVGPKPGTPVNVKLRFGALSLEQRGTIVACAGEEICAALPSGKKVAGVFSDGTLLVGGGS